MPTVSIAKGKGYSKHNDRSLEPKDKEKQSWNKELSCLNIVYKNEPVRQEYEKIFGVALDKYNQKQVEKGRPDRQIKNYYEKISRSKQEKTCYELIVQIGSQDDKFNDQYPEIQKALDEYNQSFQERNPNFHVFQQITHRDESGMDHTHIMFIPVSSGNKRGLETKNSLGGALKDMGYSRNGFDEWRSHEQNALIDIMKSYQLEFEKGDGRQEHYNVIKYKERKFYEQQAEKEQDRLSELQKRSQKAEKEILDIETTKTQLQAEINDLEAKKNNLIKSPAFEMTETHEIQSIVSELEDKQEELIQQFRNRSLDKKKEISGLTPEKLTDENIKIKGFRNDRVEMSIDTWNQIKSSHNRLVDTYNTLKEQFADLITKYFRLKEVFIKKAEDVFELFHRIRRSPRQVKIEEYEHAHEQILQSEISKKRLLAENERLIQSIQNKTEIIEDYQEQLSTKNELISDTIDFLDAFENNGISLLESFAYRNNWNYDYLKSFIPERSMQKQHDDWEIER
jgi:DNA repair exonuclease SbcCD ATPase subunit